MRNFPKFSSEEYEMNLSRQNKYYTSSKVGTENCPHFKKINKNQYVVLQPKLQKDDWTYELYKNP